MANLIKRQAKAKKKAEKLLAKQINQQKVIGDFGQQQQADWRHSTNDQTVRYPNFTDQQQQLINQQGILPQLSNSLSSLALPGSNNLSFEPIRQRALSDFHGNIVPTIAARFQALGTGGGGSPGKLNATYKSLGSAGSKLAESLAALEAEYGLKQNQQESSNYFNLLGHGLAPQFNYGVIPGQDSGNRQIWDYLKGAIPGAVVGGLTGGPTGAVYGGLQGLGLGNVADAYNQRKQNKYNSMQDFGTNPNLYNNFQNASQQRYQGYSTGFNPLNQPTSDYRIYFNDDSNYPGVNQ